MKSAIVFVLAVWLMGCYAYLTDKKKIPADNAIEEMAEDLIFKKYNIDIDLSPSSPE